MSGIAEVAGEARLTSESELTLKSLDSAQRIKIICTGRIQRQGQDGKVQTRADELWPEVHGDDLRRSLPSSEITNATNGRSRAEIW